MRDLKWGPKSITSSSRGKVLIKEFLQPFGISQEQFAKHLGGTWTQPKISAIINEKRNITEAIALDFADAFGTTPEFWLNLQNRYDLWIACQNHKKIKRLPGLQAA